MSDTAPVHQITCLSKNPPEAFCNQDVHGWFGLSYSSYLVLPRSLMQEMPAAWQHAMVALLERMHEEFPEEFSGYAVFKRDRDAGRFVKDPLRNYRYPSQTAIERARGLAPTEA